MVGFPPIPGYELRFGTLFFPVQFHFLQSIYLLLRDRAQAHQDKARQHKCHSDQEQHGPEHGLSWCVLKVAFAP